MECRICGSDREDMRPICKECLYKRFVINELSRADLQRFYIDEDLVRLDDDAMAIITSNSSSDLGVVLVNSN